MSREPTVEDLQELTKGLERHGYTREAPWGDSGDFWGAPLPISCEQKPFRVMFDRDNAMVVLHGRCMSGEHFLEHERRFLQRMLPLLRDRYTVDYIPGDSGHGPRLCLYLKGEDSDKLS